MDRYLITPPEIYELGSARIINTNYPTIINHIPNIYSANGVYITNYGHFNNYINGIYNKHNPYSYHQ